MHAFDDATESRLDALVERINAGAAWARDYHCAHDDAPVADYLVSCWTEGDVDAMVARAADDYWAPSMRAMVALLRSKGLATKAIATLLVEAAGEPVALHGYGRRAGEIESLSVGEPEEELPEELQAELSALSPEEFAYVQGRADEYLSRVDWAGGPRFYLHLNCDDVRWAFVVDQDRLADLLTEGGHATDVEIDACF